MAQRKSKHSTSHIQRAKLPFAPAHSFGYKAPFSWVKAIAVVLVAVLVFAGSVFASVYTQFAQTVSNAKVSVISQKNIKQEIVDPNAGKALNLVVFGTDSRDGDNAAISGDGAENTGNHQADTTMIVHISADRKFIDIVSIPRDSIVSVPSCTTSKGTIPAQTNVMFNSIFAEAYNQGGDLASAASCSLSAINSLTGLSISQFITVDFSGLKNMIDALGGVDVCISQDFSDENTNMSLQHGLNHLDGVQATQYARIRHGIGDGSDVMRTVRQQYLIKMLIREALKQNFLTNFDKLYQLATTALQSLNISEGMADSGTLIGLASSLRNFKTSGIYSQTVPVANWAQDPNRVVWTSEADTLWDRIKNDLPLTDVPSDADSSSDNSASSQSTQSDAQSQEQSEQSTDSSNNNSAEQTNSDSNSQSQDANQSTQTPDPNTGLIKQADGTLIDPATGGRVDPETGVIYSPTSGWSIGLADEYLNYTFCSIS
ncbi:transcriptional regulator [Alloscardovia theropitheci]|uniref:Transcriptional regulator n=1 Tax=Alloscardovia theropitheci TaxID=2496842 RepID=A0A4R0QQL9_9BIFI|nr:LCP family protein [Alloscardovia theropitheci]TCD54613.1 transcriptional regulator [Alloscardovia theropitheci]